MTKRFTDYNEAYKAAVDMSRSLKMDVSIRRQTEFGQDGYNLSLLPKPENRYGRDLEGEVVTPNSPL